jgi:flagellar protein FliO/FliZ
MISSVLHTLSSGRARVPVLSSAVTVLALAAQLGLASFALAQQSPAAGADAAAAQSAASAPAPAAPGATAPAAPAPAGMATAPQQGAAASAPAQPAPQMFPGPVQSAPAAGSLLQTIVSLLLVLALLLGLAWFMKRFGPRAMGGGANMRVIGTLSLGGRERIMVVEVADQWIVVGAAPGRVNVLATMPKQEGVEPPAPMVAGLPSGFADWLKQTIDKRNAK